jgi:hypothetical protein
MMNLELVNPAQLINSETLLVFVGPNLCTSVHTNHILEDIYMTYPTVIPLTAKVEDCCIKIKWLGKWRGVVYYQGKNRTPGVAKIKEAIHRFALNTGLPATQRYEIKTWEV